MFEVETTKDTREVDTSVEITPSAYASELRQVLKAAFGPWRAYNLKHFDHAARAVIQYARDRDAIKR